MVTGCISALSTRIQPFVHMSTKPKEEKREDRRARKTKRSLSDALTQLILEKRYDSITVQNVIDRADVGRSTFYAHFRDKEDLFLSSWEQLLDHFVVNIKWDEAGLRRFVPVEGLFAHIKNFHRFYVALVKSRKTDLIFKSGLEYLTKAIDNSLVASLAEKAQPAAPTAVISRYIAAEIFGLLKWWLDHNMPYTPQRMSQMFHQLVVPGLLSALAETNSNERTDNSSTELRHVHLHGPYAHKKIS